MKTLPSAAPLQKILLAQKVDTHCFHPRCLTVGWSVSRMLLPLNIKKTLGLKAIFLGISGVSGSGEGVGEGGPTVSPIVSPAPPSPSPAPSSQCVCMNG